MKHAIQIRDLKKSYGKNEVLKGLNLNVPQKSIYGFLGNNGAGKTTTFSILGSFLYKDSGSFEINGRMSVLPQDARFYPDRSISSQLELFARLGGLNSKQAKNKVAESLELTGLKEKAKVRPDRLSHGMTKRLSIAQTLLGNPDIILLDEPLSGLDPKNSHEIRHLIKDLAADITLVISSHILSDVAELCDTIGIIHDGTSKFEGKLSELTQKDSVVNYHLTSKPAAAIIQAIEKKNKASYRPSEKLLTIHFDAGAESLEEVNSRILKLLLEKKIQIREIQSGSNLEHEFLRTTAN